MVKLVNEKIDNLAPIDVSRIGKIWNDEKSLIGYEVDNFLIDYNGGCLPFPDSKLEKQLLASVSIGKGAIKANNNASIVPYLKVDDDSSHISSLGENDIKKREDLLFRLDEAIGKAIVTDNSEKFESSKLLCRLLAKIADEIKAEITIKSNDQTFINKRQETVYSRPIMVDGNEIGHIQYLEDEKRVTILRTDVESEFQGQGIGTRAYKQFIYDKLSKGKIVGSDSILSRQAQKVYAKLAESGYSIHKNETSLMAYGITTISREERMRQSSEMPTIFVEGARVVEPGFRMIGDPVFEILPTGGNVAYKDPVEIRIYNPIENSRTIYQVEPDKVTSIEEVSVEDRISEESLRDIKAIMMDINSNSSLFGSKITMSNIKAWKVSEIAVNEIQLAIKQDKESDLSL